MEIIPDDQAAGDHEDSDPVILHSGVLGEVTAAEVERELIQRTLEKFHFNKRKTARALGMAERTLYRKLKEYEIKKPD